MSRDSRKQGVPFDWSYWVVPGRFLAGCDPISGFSGDPRENLKALLDHGIRYIIDLTEPRSINHGYEQELKALAQDRGLNITIEHAPIENFSVPSRKVMRQILNSIDRRLEEGRPVYLHCLGGLGRTGTVVGCWLARHGTTGPAALSRLQELRQNAGNAHMASPENEDQAKMVLSWKDRE
jgi:protein tyrosine/serine phosphatase